MRIYIYILHTYIIYIYGNSAGNLFGMVSSRDPFKGFIGVLQRSGIKFGYFESPGAYV